MTTVCDAHSEQVLRGCCSPTRIAARKVLHLQHYEKGECEPGGCYCNRDARIAEWTYELMRPVMGDKHGRQIMISHVALSLHQDGYGAWTQCGPTDVARCDCYERATLVVDAVAGVLGDFG